MERSLIVSDLVNVDQAKGDHIVSSSDKRRVRRALLVQTVVASNADGCKRLRDRGRPRAPSTATYKMHE